MPRDKLVSAARGPAFVPGESFCAKEDSILSSSCHYLKSLHSFKGAGVHTQT